VTKPYYNLSSTNLFTIFGEVQHRGVELSLAGRVAAGLNLVAGAVLMDPRVTGEAVRNGRVGPRPVGQTSRLLRLNLDYALPFASGFSVDLAIVNNGARTVSTHNHVNLPARTIVCWPVKLPCAYRNGCLLPGPQRAVLSDSFGR
jgi:iron complex outermembrane receptor protein